MDVLGSVFIVVVWDGDIDLFKFEESFNFLDVSVVGVFVYGLEDEYFEVNFFIIFWIISVVDCFGYRGIVECLKCLY